MILTTRAIKQVIVLILILIFVSLTACGGAEERKASYLAKAKSYMSEENYEKARIELKNALQISPKDVEARFMLAEVSGKLQDWQQAVANYRLIIELDEKDVKARNQLGRLYFLNKNYKESRDFLDKILQIDPDNADGLTLRAMFYAKDEENEKAVNDVLAALKTDPTNIEASAMLASLYAKMGLPEKTEKIFLEAIEKHPEHIPLRVMLGDFYANEKKNNEALAVYKKIVEIKPDILMNRVRLATFLDRLNQPDEAEKVLREGIKRDPNEVESKLVLVDYFIRQGRKQQAEQELLAFIQEAPEAYRLRNSLAKFYETQGENGKAKKIYQEIIDIAGNNNDGLEARVKLAGIFIRETDLPRAEALLNEVLKENLNYNEALVLRGQLAMARNDAVGAINDFRSALKGQPNSPRILQNLARAHMLNKEYEQAINNLQSAQEIENSNSSLQLDLAQAFGLNGESKKSIELYRTVLDREPGNIQARSAFFAVLMKTQNYQEARKLAEEAIATDKDSFLGYYLSGMVFQAEKKYPESIKQLTTAIKLQPNEINVVVALVRSLTENKQNELAIKHLQEFLISSPNNVVAVNLLAEVYFLDKKYQQAIASLDKAKAIQPKWLTIYYNKVRVYNAMSNKQAAFDALDEGLKNTEYADQLVIEKSLLYEQFKEYDKAIANYEDALAKKPDSVMVANNLAMALVTHKSDEKSLARARELTRIFIDSKSPAMKDSVGWVLYKSGEIDQAIPFLEEAAAALDNAPVVNYHLGMAYYSKGDMNQSQIFLKKALVSNAKYYGVEEAKETLDKIAKADNK